MQTLSSVIRATPPAEPPLAALAARHAPSERQWVMHKTLDGKHTYYYDLRSCQWTWALPTWGMVRNEYGAAIEGGAGRGETPPAATQTAVMGHAVDVRGDACDQTDAQMSIGPPLAHPSPMARSSRACRLPPLASTPGRLPPLAEYIQYIRSRPRDM